LIIPAATIIWSKLFLSNENKIVQCTEPVVYTIFISWLTGRFWDGLNLWYKIDVFTVYFVIWQILFVIHKWERKQVPVLSRNFYRGWLCLLMACQAIVFYDAIFSYLPFLHMFNYFWIHSIDDM
jgi:hypothetical protein